MIRELLQFITTQIKAQKATNEQATKATTNRANPATIPAGSKDPVPKPVITAEGRVGRRKRGCKFGHLIPRQMDKQSFVQTLYIVWYIIS